MVKSEELAKVTDVGFGVRDTSKPMLWFTVKTLTGDALQCFRGEEALRIVQEAQCYDVKRLEDAVCVVTKEDCYVKFVRWFT